MSSLLYTIAISLLLSAGCASNDFLSTLNQDQSPPSGGSLVMTRDAEKRLIVLALSSDEGNVYAFKDSVWHTEDRGLGTPTLSGTACFDVHRQKVVLCRLKEEAASSTETWELSDGRWSLVDAKTLPPIGNAALAYDEARQMTVLFGGSVRNDNGNWEPTNNTWGWSGTSWKLLASDGPSRREEATITYYPPRRTIILFGGLSAKAASMLADTWEWNGNTWTELTTKSSPSARYSHGAAYCHRLGKIVLFGGFSNGDFMGDTWFFDGTSWEKCSVEGERPSPRANPAMAYDKISERIILLGGRDPRRLRDTWSLTDSKWSKIGAKLDSAP